GSATLAPCAALPPARSSRSARSPAATATAPAAPCPRQRPPLLAAAAFRACRAAPPECPPARSPRYIRADEGPGAARLRHEGACTGGEGGSAGGAATPVFRIASRQAATCRYRPRRTAAPPALPPPPPARTGRATTPVHARARQTAS